MQSLSLLAALSQSLLSSLLFSTSLSTYSPLSTLLSIFLLPPFSLLYLLLYTLNLDVSIFQVDCCTGHLAGAQVPLTTRPDLTRSDPTPQVGPTDQCTWEYTGHGDQIECGRDDEVNPLAMAYNASLHYGPTPCAPGQVVAGRCGSGYQANCPGATSHGSLCCELDILA